MRYGAGAAELLDNLRRTESSLQRLKRSRAGDTGGPGANALSDVDKIGAQLALDVQANARLHFI